MKITRRRLAAGAAASVAALAQTPAPTAESDDELLKGAREQVRRTGETLSRQQIPMATEPAFQFKP
jgi:hypothetical protein